MTSNEYQISAMRTCMESCHNEAYALSGITAEVGELNDKVAKWIRKGICRWDHNRLVFNTSDEAVANKYREELAYELFDFICKNVELPDVRPNPADGLVEFVKEYIEKLAKVKGECNEQP